MALLNATTEFQNWRYTSDLDIPTELDLTKKKSAVIDILQSDWSLGLYSVDGAELTTTVWGYGIDGVGGYLGPTILAKENLKIEITWRNLLPLEGHLLSIDRTLHIAHVADSALEQGALPVVTHLHGGETDAAYDGYPEAWWTQSDPVGGAGAPLDTGMFYSGDTYFYDNRQEAASLWYHDHTLGMTRLNVYAGLAGFYRLTDANEQSLIRRGVLPDTAIPLVIQDKAFTEDGQLYYPAHEDDVLPDGSGGSGSVGDEAGDFFAKDQDGSYLFPENEGQPSALPEMFGDFILVNGKAWPNHDVGQGSYTYELLNGSDSRFYVLDFVEMDGDGVDEITATAIGTDGGLLPQAVALGGPFVLAPGDRLEVVVNFSGADDGDAIRLLNGGPTYSPFKGFNPDGTLIDAEAASPDDPVGGVMQFTVDATIAADTTASVAPGDVLNKKYEDITHGPNGDDTFDFVRQVGLFEGADEFGRVQPLLGTAYGGAFHPSKTEVLQDDPTTPEVERGFGPLDWFAPTTETPLLDATEKWEIFNFTADAHPIHLHLTQFQGIGRREIMFRDDLANETGEGGEDGVPDDTTGDGGISYGRYDPSAANDWNAMFQQHDIWISDRLDPLAPEEGGRQDTLFVARGQMLEIAAHFEKAGRYVWHCHILSHEDHEMMRPMEVIDPEVLV